MAYMTRIAWRTVLAVGLLAGPAVGEQFPFTGAMTADDVNVRAGAGKNYYAVTQLSAGTLVRVHGNLYGWYEVEPPAGTFSYVAKRFVKLEGDGPTGVIREDRVRVRAPSPGGPDKSYRRQLLANEGDRVRVLGEVDGFYKIEPPAKARLFVDERFVEKATEEQIAAAGGEPKRAGGNSGGGSAAESKPAENEKPAEASSQQDGGESQQVAMKQKQEQEAEAASASSEDGNGDGSQDGEESTADASEKEKQAEESETKTADAEGDAEGQDSGGQQTASKPEMKAEKSAEADGGGEESASDSKQAAASQSKPEAKRSALPDPAEVALEELPVRPSNDRLTQLERQYLALSRRPLKEQPVGRMRMAYEKVLSEAELSRSDRALAEARIAGLETRQELKASLAEIMTTQREMTEAEQKRRAEDAKKPPEYVAVGRLTTSTLYTGEDQPLLYRLVNPLTQRTTAYVRPAGADGPDVRDMLGEYVGIEGETQYDPALKLHVIEPERVDELSASERQPRRPATAGGR